MVRIKICGLTNLEDSLKAAELGADAVGFIFYGGSPRNVKPETVVAITDKLPPFLGRVGVFVGQSAAEIWEIVRFCGLDTVQLHGTRPPEFMGKLKVNVIKSLRLRSVDDLVMLKEYGQASAFLLDTFDEKQIGGTGKSFNWQWALAAKSYGRPIILSGGLTPDNVVEAVRLARPAAVDVSSGVESAPGKKDYEKMADFIEAVEKAADEL